MHARPHVTFADSAPPHSGVLSSTAGPCDVVLLTELLTPERIKIPLAAQTKDEVLRELVEVVEATSQVDDIDDVLRAVREREEVLSTGIGNGVAIPHGRSSSIPELALAAGVAPQPVDFDALDGRPVQLFFLLVGPEAAAGQHVKVLSRISRLLRQESFRERLVNAGDAEDFYRILAEAEQS
jgi:fructose PTS system EIIBC or EIIC component